MDCCAGTAPRKPPAHRSPWRDLPERYGKWTTVASRFYRWRKVGVWDRILAELQRETDAADRFDWG